MAPVSANYRGRFAPSPTGPLHLGSLIAALASYLDARHQKGTWLVRMEDIDPPREVPGAAQQILHSLEQHGLFADEEVLYQSTRRDAYTRVLDRLRSEGYLFNCDCTRKQTGTNGECLAACAEKTVDPTVPHAVRVDIRPLVMPSLVDRIQGSVTQGLGVDLQDFVVKRKDGLDAYQLAVVVDDHEQGITDVVRGCDLLDTTGRQMYLQSLLGYRTPQYCHVPVVTSANGKKLSKQNHAPALDDRIPVDNLRSALRLLGQIAPPQDLNDTTALLRFAADNWAIDRIPKHTAISM